MLVNMAHNRQILAHPNRPRSVRIISGVIIASSFCCGRMETAANQPLQKWHATVCTQSWLRPDACHLSSHALVIDTRCWKNCEASGARLGHGFKTSLDSDGRSSQKKTLEMA
jgi:hypothetical protein